MLFIGNGDEGGRLWGRWGQPGHETFGSHSKFPLKLRLYSILQIFSNRDKGDQRINPVNPENLRPVKGNFYPENPENLRPIQGFLFLVFFD
jgi:hypothetical protein